MFNKWIKPGLILTVMFMLAWLLPSRPIDPWNILSLKKIFSMIFALAFIQVMGSVMIQLLGSRTGAVLTGFFGGLISSTATTAAMARKSKTSHRADVSTETLTFLAATIAMLFEGVAILLLGTKEIHLSLLLVFLGPILTTIGLILFLSKKGTGRHLKVDYAQLEIIPVLKLSALIVGILAISKVLQIVFGRSGILVFTFLVSLFEIHGSVIANVQLHDAGTFDVQLLGSLLAVSIAASYVSKLFLIYTFGSVLLRTRVLKCTAFLFLSLIASWLIFIFQI